MPAATAAIAIGCSTGAGKRRAGQQPVERRLDIGSTGSHFGLEVGHTDLLANRVREGKRRTLLAQSLIKEDPSPPRFARDLSSTGRGIRGLSACGFLAPSGRGWPSAAEAG